MTFLWRAHWDKWGGWIALCNKTGVGALMLLRIMFRCGAVCISIGLPCMNIFLPSAHSIPTWEKLLRAGSSVTWLLRKSGSVLRILRFAWDVFLLFRAENEMITFCFQIRAPFCGTNRKLKNKFRTQSIHSVSVR